MRPRSRSNAASFERTERAVRKQRALGPGAFALIALLVWTAPPLLAQPPAVSRSHVQAEMRQVDFHLDASIILHISYLRGELLPTVKGGVPYFDDKRSFLFSIDTARIAIGAGALGELLNRYVFSYPGSPLRNLRVSIDGGRLRQRATLRGVAVTTLNDVSVTPAGEIRLHPTTIKAAGIPVRGLMNLFGLRLQKLVNLKGARGVRAERNDLILNPAELLPPPSIRGHLTAIELRENEMVQVFRPQSGASAKPLTPSERASNYMYYRGGVLRFGKLTMTGVDLLIVDADPNDAFDFFLDRYNDQLVAGYSRTTASKALIAVMPDFNDTPSARRQGGLRPQTSDIGRQRAEGCGQRRPATPLGTRPLGELRRRPAWPNDIAPGAAGNRFDESPFSRTPARASGSQPLSSVVCTTAALT